MAECLSRGINPEGPVAPQSIKKALVSFFNIYDGKLYNITSSERAKLAENISLVATGAKSKPCYSIIDLGEGQSPDKFPDTFLSIGKSNKLRIPFVQGKFNMGGTGILQFCGKHNLQLIISKRHPKIALRENTIQGNLWGFTIVRREDPKERMKSSTYRYLAPSGKILAFKSDSLPLLPEKYPNAFGREMKWGTFIKLYEYQIPGYKTNILFDLYNRLSLLIPNIALPVRFYERRVGYRGHSFETTLAGLSVRIEEDKRENIEEDFPADEIIGVAGHSLYAKIIAFKKDSSIEKYRKGEGIIFTVNGQTHGTLSKSFFSRKAVKLSYLADSLLVIVDCSNLDRRSIEDLFMNSRDRLRSGELRSEIEHSLERTLSEHEGLRNLKEKRRRELIEGKLSDSKPLKEVIDDILKHSPTLSRLFINGSHLPNPLNITNAGTRENFEGKKFPSYFRLVKKYSEDKPRQTPINHRVRVKYKTDVVNDFFTRDNDPGRFELYLNDEEYVAENYSLSLWNGNATLNIQLPTNCKVGDLLEFESKVISTNSIEPFISVFYVRIMDEAKDTTGSPGEREKPPSNKSGDGSHKPSLLKIPNVFEVRRENWSEHSFDEASALEVKDAGDGSYDFYINVDNIHLLTEQKNSNPEEVELLKAKYKYGMTLIGIAMLYDYENDEKENPDDSDDTDIYSKISQFTRTLSPFLLPMINQLGSLELDNIKSTIF